MKVVAGLGNPGREYADTRHNVGFMLVDMIALAYRLDLRPKFQGLIAEGQSEGERFFLFKPQTFMNLSGRAMQELVKFYKIKGADILVVYDDMDLPLGRTRLRPQGSSGGHNGIRSIIGELGTEEFWRLKMGIGRPPEHWDPARYVLSQFTSEELPILKDALERAQKAVYLWLAGEGDKAMNLYNR